MLFSENMAETVAVRPQHLLVSWQWMRLLTVASFTI